MRAVPKWFPMASVTAEASAAEAGPAVPNGARRSDSTRAAAPSWEVNDSAGCSPVEIRSVDHGSIEAHPPPRAAPWSIET